MKDQITWAVLVGLTLPVAWMLTKAAFPPDFVRGVDGMGGMWGIALAGALVGFFGAGIYLSENRRKSEQNRQRGQ